jgi:hypothetical protein
MARIETLQAQLAAAQAAAREHAAAIAAGMIVVLPNGTEVSRYTAKDAAPGSEPKTLRIVTPGGTEYVPLRQVADVNGRRKMSDHYAAVAASLLAEETILLVNRGQRTEPQYTHR